MKMLIAIIVSCIVLSPSVSAASQEEYAGSLRLRAIAVRDASEKLASKDLASGRFGAYETFVSTLRRFDALVEEAPSFMESEISKAFREDVTRVFLLSKESRSDLQDALQMFEDRFKEAEANPQSGTAYGVDLKEAQSLLKSQLRRDIATLKRILKGVDEVKEKYEKLKEWWK